MAQINNQLPRRITALTDEQRAAIPAHVAKWIAVGQCTDEADWATFERAAADCYGFAGIPWHGRVVRVPNPLVLSLAAPIADYTLGQHGAVRAAVGDAVGDAVATAVHATVDEAMRGVVHAAVHATVDGAVGGAVGGPVDAAVRGLVDAAVRGLVDVGVRGPVGGALHVAVDLAVLGAVNGAVRGAVNGAVRREVDGALRDAVGDPVDDALRRHVITSQHHKLGGQWWVSWQAWTSFFRDVCGLQLPGDLWDRDRAYADAQSSAGWWYPHRDFVMVCDRPATLHLEQTGPAGWGSHRLHCEDGPAIAWRDGWGLHFWHGVHVPADLVEGDGWAPDRILTEPNTEIRRCAIEKIGWGRFVTQAGLTQVGDSVPDPGNPGRELALHDVPAAIYDEPVRVLIASNGSPDRDGRRRTFGLTVPAHITDPVHAAAWTYDCTPAEYQTLARRT